MSSLKSYDLAFEDTTIRVWEGGSGFPLVLMHGSGAGCGTFSNYSAVVDSLTDCFHVLATDMVGYGQSGRKAREPYFDMDTWIRQMQFLMQRFGGQQVGLIGHSLAGAIALKVAALDNLTAGIVATGTMGSHIRREGRGWAFPKDRAAILQHIENTLFDKSLVPPGEVEERARVLYAPGYEDYFRRMFSEEAQVYFDLSALSADELRNIDCPVLLIHGKNDRFAAPEETSIPLARDIPQADALILGRCAHSVALEYPTTFVSEVRRMFG